MIIQDEGESRIMYLMRALQHYMDEYGDSTIKYDDAECDGHILATDIITELDVLGVIEAEL